MFSPRLHRAAEPPLDTAAPLRLGTGGVWLMSIALFLLCLLLNTRENDFPFIYHPDEPGKAAQIIQGRRNFHHPLLLVSATEYATRIFSLPRTPQAVVEAGRWVSAIFAAGAVVALALIARLRYGALAGWGAGIVLCLEPRLFEAAHYMKEDTALTFGFSLGLLALALWWRSPEWRTLRFAAVASAIATSGKYIGIVFLLVALPVILRRNAEPPLFTAAKLKSFGIWFTGTLVVCNLPLFATKISTPLRGLARELDTAIGGHSGITRDVPHGEYLQMLAEALPVSLLILAALYILALLRDARSRTAAEWALVALPLVYLAVLSSSPKIAPRYLVPFTTMATFLALCGAAELSQLIKRRVSRSTASALVFAALTSWLAYDMLQAYLPVLRGFQRDDPTAAAEWVVNNVPPDAVIAEDGAVALSPSRPGVKITLPSRVPQRVLEANFAADAGTFDELRAQGVTHVVVSDKMYGRYFAEGTTPRDGQSTQYNARRSFYEQLFAQGELLQEWPRGINSYLQPGIRIYRITRPPS
jgi:hypothetical protein